MFDEMSVRTAVIDTPLGLLEVAWSEKGLHRMEFARAAASSRNSSNESAAQEFRATSFGMALERYFAGEIDALTDIPVVVEGTAFQRKVWAALRQIPGGHTESYASLAARIGHPGAARAVGSANSKNPVGIVVPCHRVIGAKRQIAGYAGGIERKQWLLDHEGAEYRA